MKAAVGCLIIGAGAGLTQAEDANPPLAAQLASGADVYAQSCANCHYEGAGNAAAPDLKGTDFWKGGPDKMITLLLKGQGGVSVVKGQKFNGEMPPMDFLTDEEIAAVTVYVRAAFGNQREFVDPAAVAKQRALAITPP